MTYLALGDSISIDDYTGVEGGGAASQLARLLRADPFVDLTRDGRTSDGVLLDLSRDGLPRPDAITPTVGGNDLLGSLFPRPMGDRGIEDRSALGRLDENLRAIADRLAAMGCPVVMNTVYDPTDGDDSKTEELGLALGARQALAHTNRTIARLAAERGFLLCDLETLFRGHGFWSDAPWLVLHIEPNLAGATAMARAWHALLKDLIAA